MQNYCCLFGKRTKDSTIPHLLAPHQERPAALHEGTAVLYKFMQNRFHTGAVFLKRSSQDIDGHQPPVPFLLRGHEKGTKELIENENNNNSEGKLYLVLLCNSL